MKRLFLIVLAVLIPHLSHAAEPTFKLAEVLKPGDYQMEIMQILPTERHGELANKVAEGLKGRQEWLKEYVSEHGGTGKPLPFHPNFGLTESEYTEFLEESEKRSLKSARQFFECTFSVDGDTLKLVPKLDFAPLQKIEIDLETTKLTAHDGDLGAASRNSNATNTIIGSWEGYSWKFENFDLEKVDGRIFGLKIYWLKGSKKLLWTVEDKESKDGASVHAYEFRFQHDLR